MKNVEFWRPIRTAPSHKDFNTLDEAVAVQKAWEVEMEKDTLWKCGSGWLNRNRGCGQLNSVGLTDIVQTHFYISPHGCTGGDYWLSGEIRLKCECGFETRAGNDNSKDYDEKVPVKRSSFRSVTDEHKD